MLRKRVEVHGRIVTPDGMPAERAYLHAPRELSSFPADITDGSFTGWIDSGRPVEIWASAEGGYAEGRTTLPASRPGDRIENVEIRLGRGARLTGKLLGISLPRTEASTSIYAEPATRDGRQAKSGEVDDEGRYEIPGLLPGTWDVKARSGHQELTRQVIIKPEDMEARLDLDFPPLFEVRGRVLSMLGAHASVRYSLEFQSESSQRTAWVSQDGSFTVELENGAYRVKHDDFIHAGGPVVVADAPVAGLEIRLVPGARLQGRVPGVPPGQPFLRFSAKGSSFQESHRESLPPYDSYLIEGLTSGDWQVEADLKYRVVRSKVTIPPDEPLTTLDFDPAFGELSLSGRLAGGDPAVQYMQVELLQEDPDITYHPDARDYGIFRFTRLREGSYRLRVYGHSATGWAVVYEQDIELSSDRELMIALSKTGR